jgi:hypothetical protein
MMVAVMQTSFGSSQALGTITTSLGTMCANNSIVGMIVAYLSFIGCIIMSYTRSYTVVLNIFIEPNLLFA